MSSKRNRLLEVIPESYGATDARLTGEGHRLIDEHPDTLGTFLDVGHELSSSSYPAYSRAYNLIAVGGLSVIYELPENENLCLKVANENTQQQNLARFPVPDLRIETKFMDAVDRRLHEREAQGIRVPRQFAAVRFPIGYASLQERIQTNYVTINKLQECEHIGRGKATEYGRRVVRGALESIGFCGLRLGIKELGDSDGWIHRRNILADERSVVTNSNLDAYIVDLVGPTKRHQRIANLVS